MDSKDLACIVETHTRVILPDFGAFLLRDSGSGTFTPENLTFSPFLKYNDNVLEEALARHREIPKDEAVRQVRDFVESIREAIQSRGYFDIPAIGRLTRDSRGAIVFTAHGAGPAQPEPGQQAGSRPSPPKGHTPQAAPGAAADRPAGRGQNAHPASTPAGAGTPPPPGEERTESAPPAERPPLAKAIAKPDGVSGGTPEEPGQPPAPPASPSSETTNNPKSTTDMAKTKKKSRITLALTLIYLAVSLTVILAIAFVIREVAFRNAVEAVEIPQDADGEIVKKATVEVDASAPAGTATPKDELDKAFDAMPTDETPSRAEGSTSIETRIEQSVIESAPDRQPPAGGYYLVAGSFNDKLNAEKYAEELNARGHRAGVLTLDNGKSYVTVGAFPTKSEASGGKERLIREFPGIWILKR